MQVVLQRTLKRAFWDAVREKLEAASPDAAHHAAATTSPATATAQAPAADAVPATVTAHATVTAPAKVTAPATVTAPDMSQVEALVNEFHDSVKALAPRSVAVAARAEASRSGALRACRTFAQVGSRKHAPALPCPCSCFGIRSIPGIPGVSGVPGVSHHSFPAFAFVPYSFPGAMRSLTACHQIRSWDLAGGRVLMQYSFVCAAASWGMPGVHLRRYSRVQPRSPGPDPGFCGDCGQAACVPGP